MDKKIKQFLSVSNYLRHREGLTLAELSARIGVPAMSISRIENGNWSVDVNPVLTLASYFKVSIDAILRNDFQAICANLTALSVPVHKMYDRLAQVSAVQQRNGLSGEEWVYMRECKRLEKTVMANAVNANYADDADAHFDILSFTPEGQPIIIEVKSTNKGPHAPFYITAAELQTAKDCLEVGIRYEVHRVYHVNDARRIGCRVITAEELFRDYDIAPKTFLVREKKEAA